MAITVVKRNGEREPYDANKINLAIEHASQGLDENITWVTQIASELELTLFDGITTQQLDEAVIQVALQNVKDDPQFDTVAARLLLKTIYKRVLGDYDDRRRAEGAARRSTSAPTIERGVAETLLDPRLTQLFDLERLAAALEPTPRRAAQVHRRRHAQQPLRHQGPQRRAARGAAVLLDAHRHGPLAQRGRPHDRRARLLRQDVEARLPRGRLHARQRGHRVPAALQLLRHGDAGRHRAHRQERARRHVAHQGHRRHRPLGDQAARAGLADPLEQHHVDRPDPVHAHDRLGAARGQPRRQEVRRPLLLHGELAPRLPRVPRPPAELRRPVPPHPHREHRGLDQRRVHEARAERRRLVPLRPARGHRPQRALRQGVLGALRVLRRRGRGRPDATCSRRSARASSSSRS